MSHGEISEVMLRMALSESVSFSSSNSIKTWYDLHLLERSTVDRISEVLPGVYALYEKQDGDWKCFYVNRSSSIRNALLSFMNDSKLHSECMKQRLRYGVAFAFCVVLGDDVREIVSKFIYEQIRPECNGASDFTLSLPIPLPPLTYPNRTFPSSTTENQSMYEKSLSDSPSGVHIQKREQCNSFRFCGKGWEVVYNGKSTIEKNLIGMKYIHVLLKHPRVPFDVQSLSGYVTDSSSKFAVLIHGHNEQIISQEILSIDGRSEIETIIDDVGKQRVKKEIEKLIKKRNDAIGLNKMEDAEKYDDEIGKIEKFYSKAIGKNGKLRPMNTEQEKERKRLSAAIHRSMKALVDNNEALYNHFYETIKIGIKEVIYLPREEIVWVTG